MTAVRDGNGIAVPLQEIGVGDRVVTADGQAIGTARRVYDRSQLDGYILVVGHDDVLATTVAYTIPLWAPRYRDAAGRRLYLAAHLSHVRTRWLFASVL
jgi:hypothetical protein